jgi:hypothetical protein
MQPAPARAARPASLRHAAAIRARKRSGRLVAPIARGRPAPGCCACRGSRCPRSRAWEQRSELDLQPDASSAHDAARTAVKLHRAAVIDAQRTHGASKMGHQPLLPRWPAVRSRPLATARAKRGLAGSQGVELPLTSEEPLDSDPLGWQARLARNMGQDAMECGGESRSEALNHQDRAPSLVRLFFLRAAHGSEQLSKRPTPDPRDLHL